MNMNLKLSKEFNGTNFKGLSHFQILSSLEKHLVSFSTGAQVEKAAGSIASNAFIEVMRLKYNEVVVCYIKCICINFPS